ncbi:TolB family protein [Hufsiella ginkgonis]|uniref:TolB protein n=1 Tax=Hufsiella ginkgonis TaxID=2695274 RepID=A0A7K1XYE6_9SPHI|nr:hypothetical protein [Hufsiella ginkgonis]MXV16000.1 hypothetical protein [Hufsiella ginkgonis]
MKRASIYNYKTLSIKYLLTIILTLTFQKAFSQLFDESQNPPSLEWRQLNTKNFQVVYPAGLESEARRMANTLTAIIEKVSRSYHKVPRKITVILQNQGTTSNGFVQLAPRRSEFFTIPSQEFDYQDWLNSLAVHELRHVVQFDKLAGGFKAPLESLGLAIFGITLPPWFYEGDAVVTETALTHAGRGRQAEFDLPFRANLLSGRRFSYSKNYLGSLTDNTPGYYPLGYFMTAKLRRDYGPRIMDSILSRVARAPFLPYRLSRSIKKLTGMNTRQLHDSTVAELTGLWKQQQVAAGVAPYAPINKRRTRAELNYLMPVAVAPGKTAVLRRGVGQVPAIVLLGSAGKETTLVRIGIQEEPYFRYAAGLYVWDEFRFDARFHKRSFNVVMSYDPATGAKRQLTHKTRLFAPNVSPDGQTIIAVAVSYANVISLVEMDRNGKTLREFPSPGNDMLQNPSWHASGQKVVVTGVSGKGKTLYELDCNTGKFTMLMPYLLQLISKPVYIENKILYKGQNNGTDNLMLLDPGRSTLQVTSSPYGAYNPSYDAATNRVLFNDYQPSGYNAAAISAAELSGSRPAPGSEVLPYIEPVAKQEGNRDVFDSIPAVNYPSKPYREFANLFYFHSLVPIAEENDYFNDNNYGLKLQSNNKLNTLGAYVGYQYNNALGRSEYLAGLTWSRLFPVFDLSYLNRARFTYVKRLPTSPLPDVPVSWRENAWEATMKIPLVFNRLNKTYGTGFEVSTSYVTRYGFENRPGNVVTRLKFPMSYRFYESMNTQRSARDLAPRWGQNMSVQYRHFPFENQLQGELLTFKSTFFFPGLFLNHSLQASFNYQEGSGNYDMTNDIPRVSGYSNLPPAGAVHNTLLTAYRMPLFYPDWEIGPLAYIKRFTGGFFADFENAGHGNRFAPRTFGAEVRADMNLLRFYLPDFSFSTKIIFSDAASGKKTILDAGFTYNY